MNDLIANLSAWAMPSILGVTAWFVVKKFEAIEESEREIKRKIDIVQRNIHADIEKTKEVIEANQKHIQESLRIIREHFHETKNALAIQIGKVEIIYKNIEEMKEDRKEYFGKIIILESSVKTHNQILKIHNEDIKELKKKTGT
jgi:hypothetical protein